MPSDQPPFRIAFRVEKEWWVAYLAPFESMKDAQELGRILLVIVQAPHRKEVFMELMKTYMTDELQRIGAPIGTFDTRIAPEHERSKEEH